jgi:hypothetical protein
MLAQPPIMQAFHQLAPLIDDNIDSWRTQVRGH